jgi:hypothetical protein
VLKKKIWANFQRIIELFTQKTVTKLSKVWVCDPRSGIRKKLIPDPGSRIQGSKRHRIPDPDPRPVMQSLCMAHACLITDLCTSWHTSTWMTGANGMRCVHMTNLLQQGKITMRNPDLANPDWKPNFERQGFVPFRMRLFPVLRVRIRDPVPLLTFAPMRGIYLRLKKVYIYTFKNTVFFFHVNETNFLDIFLVTIRRH